MGYFSGSELAGIAIFLGSYLTEENPFYLLSTKLTVCLASCMDGKI